jgi:hypothetical protein
MTPQALGQQMEQDWKSIYQRVPTLTRKKFTHEKAWRFVFARREKGK